MKIGTRTTLLLVLATLACRDDANRFYQLGIADQFRGDYATAVANYDRALAIDPRHALATKNRGRSHFYLGNFTQAAADLSKGLALDTANIHVTMWLHLIRHRLGQDDRAEFAANLARTDTVNWPGPAARHYLGRISTAELLAAATHPDSATNADRLCTARFHAGAQAIIAGKPQEARALFEQIRATCRRDFSEYAAAVAELGRITP